jgi:hypothetical protein
LSFGRCWPYARSPSSRSPLPLCPPRPSPTCVSTLPDGTSPAAKIYIFSHYTSFGYILSSLTVRRKLAVGSVSTPNEAILYDLISGAFFWRYLTTYFPIIVAFICAITMFICDQRPTKCLRGTQRR